MKPSIGFSSKNLPKSPHNYNPNGRNKFEDDALLLRAFWGSLTDYPNLWFNGSAPIKLLAFTDDFAVQIYRR